MPKRKDQDGLYKRADSPFWWASYTDASGARTRRSTQTADRKEAEALLAKWKLAAHQEKHWDAPPRHTFDELMLAYLADTKAIKSSAERDHYSAKRLYPVFTGRMLDSLTPADIRQYIRQRKSEDIQPGCCRRWSCCALRWRLAPGGRNWSLMPIPAKSLVTRAKWSAMPG